MTNYVKLIQRSIDALKQSQRESDCRRGYEQAVAATRKDFELLQCLGWTDEDCEKIKDRIRAAWLVAGAGNPFAYSDLENELRQTAFDEELS